MKKLFHHLKVSFRWRHLICLIAVLFLALSIFLFIVLFLERLNIYYYLTASSATIGFGFLTLFFSIDAAIKRNYEFRLKRTKSTNNALIEFGETISSIDFVYLSCVSSKLQELIGVDCLDNDIWEEKNAFTVLLSKKYNEYVTKIKSNIDKSLQDMAKKYFKSIYKQDLVGTDYEIDLAIKTNHILSRFEPLAYMYINDEFTSGVFNENMKPDIRNIYCLYSVLVLSNVFERNCDFIELSIFNNSKNVILKK